MRSKQKANSCRHGPAAELVGRQALAVVVGRTVVVDGECLSVSHMLKYPFLVAQIGSGLDRRMISVWRLVVIGEGSRRSLEVAVRVSGFAGVCVCGGGDPSGYGGWCCCDDAGYGYGTPLLGGPPSRRVSSKPYDVSGTTYLVEE